MFSEFNEQRVATSLELEVVQALGFELAEQKLHVSVHLNDYGRPGGAPAGVVVSLVVADKEARACTVRKIKSSTAKVRGGVRCGGCHRRCRCRGVPVGVQVWWVSSGEQVWGSRHQSCA